MDKMPLVAVIFNSIPESIILFCFGIAIVGERINIKKVLIAAVIDAFVMMLIRWFVPYFGLHSIIAVFVYFVLFRKLIGLKAWKSIISSLLSLTALILLDDFILFAILELENITVTEVMQDNFRRIIYTYPSLAILGLITLVIYFKKWFLIKGSRVSNVEYIKEKMKGPLIVTTIVLFQGIILVILNMYFGYINNHSLITKIFSFVYFTLSIIFLKYFWSLKDEIDESIRSAEMHNNEINFNTFNSGDF
ncbi:MAG: hypothetical protein VR69_05025 [Peptococcaceae bacterium BRH_c4b]|nr:MAG: hypothetical protein VR69_05025 [Peptococcaceae bacterium BRH_c4b]